MSTAEETLRRCARLDRHTATPGRLERVYLSPEHAAANTEVAGWFEHAGMTTRVDAAGNLWGRVEGREPGLPALVLGSHLDTVPDAGSYDGILGVMMALAVVERLRDRPGGLADLPCALEVVGFSDEEGARFGKALLGSQAVAGTWDDDWWTLRDAHGTTLQQAFCDFGLDPAAVGEAARRPDDVVAYLEAHIEQGPYLETADRSLGFVTTIAGARRFRVVVRGEARHAGGTPYERRRDALVGAAAAIQMIESVAKERGVLATVGRVEAHPGAVNVIPGRAIFSLDLRAEDDPTRDAAWDAIAAGLDEICTARLLKWDVAETHRAPAARCADRLRDAVVDGIRSTGDDDPTGLWSPAGHDAMAIAAIADIGMLFVRCHDGISHHPDESVREVDVAAGLDAFEHAVLAVLAAEERNASSSS